MKAAILTNQLFSWENPNELAIGGGEKVTLQLSELLQEIEYDVSVYQYSPISFSNDLFGAHIHGISNFPGDGLFWTNFCDYFYNETKDFDLVIINLPDFTSGKVREDSILITHGIFWCGKALEKLSEYEKTKLRKAFSNVGKNIVVHEFTRDAIRSLGLNAVADKVVCIENYVDTDVFKPDEKLPIVIFPGRAENAKGTGIVREVLDLLPSNGYRVEWIGYGSQYKNLKLLEEHYDNFYAYSVPMEDMHKVYARASICVVMNTSSRGNSLTLMEGMASKCACVGIDGGTTLITNMEDGLLCDATPESIANSIMLLMSNDELRSFLGKNAREKIIKDHSRIEWKEKWINLINGRR